MSSKGKVLWVGDSPAVCSVGGKSFATTGFGKVTEETLGRLPGLGWEVVCLGVNHPGDPHDKGYPIYTAMSGGDLLGLNRLVSVIQQTEPDVVVLFNDVWVLSRYYAVMSQLERVPPTVAYFPIDSPGYSDRHTGWAKRAVQAKDAKFRAATYTEWGAKVFQAGGYPALIDVIPHGVNTEVFYPIDRSEARKQLGVEDTGQFIVLNANRNSERKRIDMTIRAFVRFCKERGIKSGEQAQLWLHMAAHEPNGYDTLYLMDRYCKDEGIENDNLLRITYPGFNNYNAVTPDHMNLIYNACDITINTSVAEGWALCPFEGAACGKPSIMGNHSAQRCLWGPSEAFLVRADDTQTTSGLHLDHAVMDAEGFVFELKWAYDHLSATAGRGISAMHNVLQPRYSWDAIASQWDRLLSGMMED